MSGKRPFSKFKAKSSSTPGANISVRFNRLDEELEELYSHKEDAPAADEYQSSDPLLKSNSAEIISKSFSGDLKETSSCLTSAENSVVGDDNDNISCNSAAEEIQNEKNEIIESGLQELPSIPDSVKDYAAKISRRAYSLGSDSAESETWPVLKELKGRLVKNIEDCINKDVVKGLTPAEICKLESEAPVEHKASSFEVKQISHISKSLHTDLDDIFSDKDEHLSPSVEATEFIDDSVFDNVCKESASRHSTSKTGKSILSTVSAIPPALPLRKKKFLKSNASMTLSTLMASRSQSLEYEKAAEEMVKDFSNKENLPSKEISRNVSSDIEIKRVSEDKNFLKFMLKLQYFQLIMKPFKNNSVSAFVVLFFVCILTLISSWLSGFLMGILLSTIVMYVLMKPSEGRKPYVLPDYSKLPPLTIDTTDADTEGVIYMGWMNELSVEYCSDTYHVNSTHSVYVRLDGSYLRMSYPKTNVPRRAMYNEPRHELSFIYQRHYDITGATIELLPVGLSNKRLWSKKYPLCLVIPNAKQAVLSDSSKGTFTSDRHALKGIVKESSPVKKYFPKVTEDNEIVLYLFARTDREKDDWYRRFLKASKIKMLKSHSPSSSSPNIAAMEYASVESKRTASVDLGSLHLSSSSGNIHYTGEQASDDYNDDSFTEIKFDKHLRFEFYMTQLLSPKSAEYLQSPLKYSSLKEKRDLLDVKSSKSQNHSSQNLLWLNALVGRLFFDFLAEEIWADVVSERIQKKLSRIKLPHFMEELKITDINLGSALPKIHRASEPVVDQRGLWIDMDISYNGSFKMTLETKLNLLKLRKHDSSSFLEKENEMKSISSHMYDSDEDSAESSSDEDVPLGDIKEPTNEEEKNLSLPSASSGSSTSKKFLKLVDKIAQSSYFRHAAKNKYVKRAMEEVSNTPLVLTVEVQWLTGTIALNIPPLPTDRLWYGFRKNPDLSIMARPKLGCHAVTITHITEWIEKKLVLEFQKLLVMPNMDEFIIPIMNSGFDWIKP